MEPKIIIFLRFKIGLVISTSQLATSSDKKIGFDEMRIAIETESCTIVDFKNKFTCPLFSIFLRSLKIPWI